MLLFNRERLVSPSKKLVPLAAGYSADAADLSREQWHELLAHFSDANLYQTWDYDEVRWGAENLSQLVLRYRDEVVAVAQVRLARLPGLRWGAAYVRWGPVWRRSGRPNDIKVFRMALRALRNEYVCRRGLVLRVFPLAFEGQGSPSGESLADEMFVQAPDESPSQTLLVNIETPLDELRKGFDKKWRNCLNHAERNALTVIQGSTDELFADFIPLYKQMVARKKFTEPNDINEFRVIQQRLPDSLKMRIFLCTDNGELSGGAICSATGDTGLYIFGATNESGMKNKCAYLLQWHALQWLKDEGCRYYNLNGINPVKNPGGYHFKAGVAGKAGQELHYLGRFDCYARPAQQTLTRLGLRVWPFLQRLLVTRRPS
jgi:hypothetical protein